MNSTDESVAMTERTGAPTSTTASVAAATPKSTMPMVTVPVARTAADTETKSASRNLGIDSHERRDHIEHESMPFDVQATLHFPSGPWCPSNDRGSAAGTRLKAE